MFVSICEASRCLTGLLRFHCSASELVEDLSWTHQQKHTKKHALSCCWYPTYTSIGFIYKKQTKNKRVFGYDWLQQLFQYFENVLVLDFCIPAHIKGKEHDTHVYFLEEKSLVPSHTRFKKQQLKDMKSRPSDQKVYNIHNLHRSCWKLFTLSEQETHLLKILTKEIWSWWKLRWCLYMYVRGCPWYLVNGL